MKTIDFRKCRQILLLVVVSLLLFVNSAPLSQDKTAESQQSVEKVDATSDKSKSDAVQKHEVNDTQSSTTSASVSTTPAPKTMAKSPEVAEPPESQPSGSIEKRSSGLPVLDTQMPSESSESSESSEGDQTYYDSLMKNLEGDAAMEGLNKDDDFYLRAILSNPQLVRDIMEEETRLREFQQVPADMDVDLKPTSVAWYVLATGDIEGVTRMINALVAYGALNPEEARDYRMAVEEEYSSLTQAGLTGLAYPQQQSLPAQEYEAESDYAAALPYPVGIPAYPVPVEYDPSLSQQEEASDYQPYGSSFLSAAMAPEQQQRADEDYYYDGIMKELLEAMSKENNIEEAQKQPADLAIPKSEKIPEKSSMNKDIGKSHTSLEAELEDLPQGMNKDEESENSVNTPQEDLSIEEQLEQLMGNISRDQPRDSAEKQQKQNNRTKPLQSLESKTNHKKDNQKKA